MRGFGAASGSTLSSSGHRRGRLCHTSYEGLRHNLRNRRGRACSAWTANHNEAWRPWDNEMLQGVEENPREPGSSSSAQKPLSCQTRLGGEEGHRLVVQVGVWRMEHPRVGLDTYVCKFGLMDLCSLDIAESDPHVSISENPLCFLRMWFVYTKN